MKYKLLTILCTSILLLSNCEKIYENDNLSLEKRDYSGNQLRIDGYYYYTFYNQNIEDTSGATTIFFYSNGVFVDLGGFRINDIEEHENKIRSGESIETARQYMTSWGLFNIDGNTIKFERWYPSSGGPLKAYVRKGNILNDTTFHITQSYRMQDGEKTEMDSKDEVYHFRQFSPKPDSTNSFVK